MYPYGGAEAFSLKGEVLVLAMYRDPTLSSKDQWSHDQSVVNTYSQGESPLVDNV